MSDRPVSEALAALLSTRARWIELPIWLAGRTDLPLQSKPVSPFSTPL